MLSSASLKSDLPASLVVFLVALPLSLGIALASNAPVMAGLIAAAVGGIVVGSLAGAPLQVSGPAAGLVVTVFALTEQVGGDWRAVCAITLMAGLVQIGLGSVRVARAALAISPAVVHGMLAGIGVLIALAQVHVILGGRPRSSALQNLRDLPGQVLDLHGAAALLGLLTLALLGGWSWLPWAALRRVPAPLVAVTLTTLLALGLGAEVERVDLRLDDHVHPVQAGEQLPDPPAAPVGDEGRLLSALSLPVWPSSLTPWALCSAVIGLALIASVESLLCAVATDKLHTGPRARLDRELVAQGVGNTLSGMLGGLPVTGVIVRSSANVTAGARTRLSGILHGVWILLFVALLPFVIESIPKCALAALLVFVGVRLVNPHHVRDLRLHGELPIYLITVTGVVFIDLLAGVGIGFGCALLRLLWRMARVKVEVASGDPWEVRISGALTFLGVPRLLEALATVPVGARARVDLGVTLLDHAGWEALDGWRRDHDRTGGSVELEGLPRVWSLHPAPQGAPATRGRAPDPLEAGPQAPVLASSGPAPGSR